jgi:hypothetical protein
MGMPEPQPVPVVAQAAIVREARGGRRKATVLIVAEPDPAKAREILRGRLPGFHVDELYPLPSGCLEAFGLKAGEYTRWLGTDTRRPSRLENLTRFQRTMLLTLLR